MSRVLRTFAAGVISATVLLGAGSAQAISSIDFVWLDSGTPTLSPVTSNVHYGSVHTGAIVLTGDDPSAFVIVFTLLYDTFELDFVAAREHFVQIGPAMAGARLAPITAGVHVDEANGLINLLDWSGSFVNLDPCGAGCVVTLGTVTFRAFPSENAAFWDRDIRLGLFTPGVDGVFTATGAFLPVAFGTAAVPEPSEALLLTAGVGFLAYAGRRSNR